MSIFGSGTQSDWYAAGMLLMQLGFLVAGVWFAHNFLKTIRGFQEQLGALVKLSVTGTPPQHHEASTIARRTLGDVSPNWGAASKAEAAGTETENRGVNRVEASGYRFLCVEAPTARVPEGNVSLQTEAVGEQTVGSWRRLGSWLQAPIHASAVNPEATGLRRVIQWLGAPAGG